MTDSTSSSASPEPRAAAMDKASFRRWNEIVARKYDPEMFHRHPNRLVRWIEARRVRAIIRLLATRLTDGVLEVGCGAGNILDLHTHRSLLDGLLRVEVVRAVPWPWLPLRYVVRCRPVWGVNGSAAPAEGSL